VGERKSIRTPKRSPHKEASMVSLLKDPKAICTNKDCRLRTKGCKGFEGCPGFRGK
jgi:hypothetical protein